MALPAALQYGLIGYPLGHSFSPDYFRKKFAAEGIDASYKAYPLASVEALPELLKQTPLHGLNVTIPYKEVVIPFLNERSEEARAIGAVNCISISNGLLTGHNTDWIGFQKSLEKFLPQKPLGALILGTGGAAKAVRFALQKMSVPFQNIARRKTVDAHLYEEITPELLHRFPLLINTTPLGTWPDTAACPPVPYSLLKPENALYDLIYNPAETTFLTEGRRRGCPVKNGIEMLEIQAEESWRIWQLGV